ncbi:MAG: GNAT family N-acetyltransferase, partial [Pseudomonadota bacterium]
MNEPIEFRAAVSADVSAVKQCAAAAYHKYIERIGREPAPMVADFESQIAQSLVQVMTVGESFGGFAVCYAKSDCYFLENIAIYPAFQSCGYGAQLLHHVHSLAAPFKVVRLYTNEKMVENLSW